MNSPQPTVFLHVGTRKSGTSFLQKALRDSAPQLREQGVNLTFKTRAGHVNRQLLPLQEYALTGDSTAARNHLEKLVSWIAREPELRHLLSLEDLGELPPQVADLMMDALSEFDVHLIVTARHWGSTIPSEWQQCVKERDTVTYLDFVTAIRDRTEDAALFLSRQDVPALVERWRHGLPADRVHVIAVPPSTRTEGTIIDLFCGLIGVDPGSLQIPRGQINQSIELAQAELLRRVNLSLGDRLPDLETDYKAGVREWLTRGSLMRHATTSIRLPDEFADWCVEQSRMQYDGLVALGVDLVGRPEDLLLDGGIKTGPAEVDDDVVAGVAVTALADLAVQRWQEVSNHRARVASFESKIAGLETELAAEREKARAAEASVGLVTRVGRRVRRAVAARTTRA